MVRDERVICASSSMQGWRLSMEDVHRTLLNMNGAPPGKRLSFFGVYDGHGGVTSAVYSGAMLHAKISAERAFTKGNYAEAIRRGFLATDREMRSQINLMSEQSGCTAVIVLLTDDWRVIVGNAGDSRAVLSYNGIAVPLSHDHRPMDTEESRRIVAGGGYIENNRVNGNLALSRAIGDFRFKTNTKLDPENQIVTANPDVIERTLLDEDEFIIIACDGIWDCISSQQAVSFVRKCIIDGTPIERICEQIMDECVADNIDCCEHGHDNMTIIIIALLNNQPEAAWREAIGSRPVPVILQPIYHPTLDSTASSPASELILVSPQHQPPHSSDNNTPLTPAAASGGANGDVSALHSIPQVIISSPPPPPSSPALVDQPSSLSQPPPFESPQPHTPNPALDLLKTTI